MSWCHCLLGGNDLVGSLAGSCLPCTAVPWARTGLLQEEARTCPRSSQQLLHSRPSTASEAADDLTRPHAGAASMPAGAKCVAAPVTRHNILQLQARWLRIARYWRAKRHRYAFRSVVVIRTGSSLKRVDPAHAAETAVESMLAWRHIASDHVRIAVTNCSGKIRARTKICSRT